MQNMHDVLDDAQQKMIEARDLLAEVADLLSKCAESHFFSSEYSDKLAGYSKRIYTMRVEVGSMERYLK